jgi:hypothetical protein
VPPSRSELEHRAPATEGTSSAIARSSPERRRKKARLGSRSEPRARSGDPLPPLRDVSFQMKVAGVVAEGGKIKSMSFKTRAVLGGGGSASGLGLRSPSKTSPANRAMVPPRAARRR